MLIYGMRGVDGGARTEKPRRGGESMTHEEAIQELTGMYRIAVVDSLDATLEAERKNKALDMAIEALEKQMPRLLRAEELKSGMAVWVDDRSWESVSVLEIREIQIHKTQNALFFDRTKERQEVYFCGTTWTNYIELYGVEWVAWTAKPNLTQRRSVDWQRSEEAAWYGVGYYGKTTAIE